MEKIMTSGIIPALSSRNLCPQLICCRSSRDNTGPRFGLKFASNSDVRDKQACQKETGENTGQP